MLVARVVFSLGDMHAELAREPFEWCLDPVCVAV